MWVPEVGLDIPSPRDGYRPGRFRLAGFGGAAVFLRTGIAGGGSPYLTLDVGLLTPQDYTWFLHRPMTTGLSDELGQFFFDCASDMNPELTVAAVHDPLSGLEVSVVSSTDSQVELEVSVGDEDGIGFQTSRVALTLAAQEVLVLERTLQPEQTGE